MFSVWQLLIEDRVFKYAIKTFVIPILFWCYGGLIFIRSLEITLYGYVINLE
jgi:hypothetical protein